MVRQVLLFLPFVRYFAELEIEPATETGAVQTREPATFEEETTKEPVSQPVRAPLL